MPITMTVDHPHQRVLVRAEGEITFQDIKEHLESEDHAGGLSYLELVDGRGAHPTFTTGQARSIVEMLRRMGERSRLGPTAIIVDNDLAFGVFRMLEILLGDLCALRPFRDAQAAEQWLEELG